MTNECGQDAQNRSKARRLLGGLRLRHSRDSGDFFAACPRSFVQPKIMQIRHINTLLASVFIA